MQVLERYKQPELQPADPAPTHWTRRPWPIAGVLLAVYLVLGFLVDVDGHLASDIGGKIGSVEAIAESRSLNLDIGYWFEDVDPDGRFHAYFSTKNTANGTWINSTTLPMVVSAGFLWALGGMRAILLLPMLGSLLSAFAARRLHQRLQPGNDGAASMWTVGLSSPALVYSFTFWEHSLGLGFMLLAISLVLDATDEREDLRRALLAGLAFGAAATMRQEALVYGFVGGVAVAGVWAFRTRWLTAVRSAATYTVGAVAPVALNALAEIVILGESLRTARAGSTFGASGGSGSNRVSDAVGVTLGAFSSVDVFSLSLSGLLAISMLALALSVWRQPETNGGLRPATIAVLVSWVLWAGMMWLVGPVAVPGSAIAAPLSIFGLIGAITTPRWRLPLAVGVLGPLPLILLTAFPGFGFAQWGGRYHLASTAVLVVMGLIWLAGRDQTVLRVILGCTALVTLAGAIFLIDRTHAVGDEVRHIEQTTAPETVVVWRDTLVAREFGSVIRGRNWLSAPHAQDQAELSQLLHDEGITSFLWIGPPNFEHGFVGFTPAGVQTQLDHLEQDVILMTASQ